MLVAVVVLATLLVGMVGLAIDAAFVGTAGQQLQSAADAAALSAARMLRHETLQDGSFPLTRQAAIDIALVNEAASAAVQLTANTANAPDGDIVVGRWNAATGAFTASTSAPNAVRVRARRTSASAGGPLDLVFGAVFGAGGSDVTRTATAVSSLEAEPLLLLLATSGPGALALGGDPVLDVSAGEIHSNSADACSLQLAGAPSVSAALTTTVGGGCYPEGAIAGAVVEHGPPLPDPLAGVLPDAGAWDACRAGMPAQDGTGKGRIAGSGTFAPGHYAGGIDLKAGHSVALQPGVYMLGGKGLTMKGGAGLTGSDVTLLIDLGADVDISGHATLSVAAPGSGPFEGVALFSHRLNGGGGAGDPEVKVGGTGDLEVRGIVYVPAGTFVMAGTPGNKHVGALIVHTLTNSGGSGFVVTGDGVPASGGRESAFLVE